MRKYPAKTRKIAIWISASETTGNDPFLWVKCWSEPQWLSLSLALARIPGGVQHIPLTLGTEQGQHLSWELLGKPSHCSRRAQHSHGSHRGQAPDKHYAGTKTIRGCGKRQNKKEKQQKKCLKCWQASFLFQFWGTTTLSKSTATEILQRIKNIIRITTVRLNERNNFIKKANAWYFDRKTIINCAIVS